MSLDLSVTPNAITLLAGPVEPATIPHFVEVMDAAIGDMRQVFGSSAVETERENQDTYRVRISPAPRSFSAAAFGSLSGLQTTLFHDPAIRWAGGPS